MLVLSNFREMSGKAKETDSKRVGLGTYRAPTLQDSPTLKMSKARIQKNLVVVSFGFLCLFTAFESLSNLQSSINKDASLGTNGLATIYAALVVSCMFLPPVIIARLGCKWTIAFSMLCYILYMCANFYVRYYTIIPSAIILGLGAAPLWSAKCTYLTETGVWYSKLTGTTEDDVINRFFGFFFMVFQISKYTYLKHANGLFDDTLYKSCGFFVFYVEANKLVSIFACGSTGNNSTKSYYFHNKN